VAPAVSPAVVDRRRPETSPGKNPGNRRAVPRLSGVLGYRIYGNMGAKKTAVEIPDSLFRQAKAVAAQQGMSLKDFFAQAREHRSPLVSRDQHFRAVSGLRLLTWVGKPLRASA
jgi:hypothetical protein